MALKKSQLYSSLWSSCDELRGSMDASQYKDYVLVLLFVKYVSDKYAGKPDALIEIPPGGGFADMVALKGDKEIGDKINKIIGRLAEANDLKGVIDQADFNDADKLGQGKEMQERLSRLVAIFDSLDFRANRAAGDDLLGDAYEYLMRHFATESGKSKGQFYTPAEVSRILAKIVGAATATRPDQTIYDPTCGSGSLLLKAADEAPKGVTIYGQENDLATWAMARMNMILHGHPTALLWKGNTLSTPYFKNPDGTLATFDFAVANPPFSAKAWSSGFNPFEDEFKRFEFGVPPPKNGDYAFLLHVIKSLKSTGKAAVILPHGVLFRGNAEADIRRQIVNRGLIKGIVGLPANLFYGTGIRACIVVLDKETARARTGVFMIDASKGFAKDGPKNRLRAQDIHLIVDAFTRQLELPRFSRLVPLDEIEANQFNLNISRYIDSTEPDDIQDLDAHMRGGIPTSDIDALERYWRVFPAVRDELLEPVDRPGYLQLKVPVEQVKATILSHPQFDAFKRTVTSLFERWRLANRQLLEAVFKGSDPKRLIEALSESLLEIFRDAPLLDAYDVYQHLMDQWEATMQDDVYMVASEGWKEALRPRLIIEDTDKKDKEKADLTIGKLKYKTDLASPALLIARYYSGEQAAIDEQESEVALLEQKLEELGGEHGGEDGLLSEVAEEGKITKNSVIARLSVIADDIDSGEERAVLKSYLELIERQAVANTRMKELRKALEALIAARYTELSEAETKSLVVDDKWLTTLALAVESELDRVSDALTSRIRQLAERYATPLPELTAEVAALRERVDVHLKDMGAKWN